MAVAVRSVMRRDVVAVAPDTPFKELVATVRDGTQRAVPVVDDLGRVLGVVSESDLLCHVAELPHWHVLESRRTQRARRTAAGRTAAQLMRSPAVTVADGATVREAAQLAFDADVRQLPVVDEFGRLEGLVTRGSLLAPFLRPDEELAADIRESVVTGGFCLDPRAVEVEVRGGVAMLRGQVESEAVRRRLAHAVADVEGVVAVDDALTCPADAHEPAGPLPLFY